MLSRPLDAKLNDFEKLVKEVETLRKRNADDKQALAKAKDEQVSRSEKRVSCDWGKKKIFFEL